LPLAGRLVPRLARLQDVFGVVGDGPHYGIEIRRGRFGDLGWARPGCLKYTKEGAEVRRGRGDYLPVSGRDFRRVVTKEGLPPAGPRGRHFQTDEWVLGNQARLDRPIERRLQAGRRDPLHSRPPRFPRPHANRLTFRVAASPEWGCVLHVPEEAVNVV